MSKTKASKKVVYTLEMYGNHRINSRMYTDIDGLINKLTKLGFTVEPDPESEKYDYEQYLVLGAVKSSDITLSTLFEINEWAQVFIEDDNVIAIRL